MGIATGQTGRGGRGYRRRGRQRALVSEINVTPFVDVMLVLLIIFMGAAPLMTVGVEVDLPDTEAGAVSTQTDPIYVQVSGDGKISLQDTEISFDELLPKLQAIAQTGYEERIMVLGDRDAEYGTLSRVMGRINGAGYRNQTLIHLPSEGN